MYTYEILYVYRPCKSGDETDYMQTFYSRNILQAKISRPTVLHNVIIYYSTANNMCSNQRLGDLTVLAGIKPLQSSHRVSLFAKLLFTLFTPELEDCLWELVARFRSLTVGVDCVAAKFKPQSIYTHRCTTNQICRLSEIYDSKSRLVTESV